MPRIIITDEMVVAGNDALAGQWVALTSPEFGLSAMPDAVAAVYGAMENARVQPQTAAEDDS